VHPVDFADPVAVEHGLEITTGGPFVLAVVPEAAPAQPARPTLNVTASSTPTADFPTLTAGI
jgi:hypothetical protein